MTATAEPRRPCSAQKRLRAGVCGRRSACCCRSGSRWSGRLRSGRACPTAGWCRRRRSSSTTFVELAATGELQRHMLATLLRVAAGFGIGVVGRHAARRDRRLFGAAAPPARSDPAGAARDPVDRLGAAVHPLVRHLRGLEDHADRGRRVLPGLSRRDGRDHVGRSQDRRGRPRVPPVRPRHGPAHPAAGGAAGLCALAALRPRPRLDVRGRRRIPGRLGRPRLSADRRPAARQAGADRRRHRRLRDHRQDHRLDHRRRSPRRSCAGKTPSARRTRPDMLVLERVGKTYPERRARARRHHARRRAGRDRRGGRRLGLRQVDLAARGLRPRHADARARSCSTARRSPRRTRRSASSSRSRGCCRG